MNKTKYIILLLGSLVFFVSCKDQSETYADFVNELSYKNYPGKLLNVNTFAGKNRVKIEALSPRDPSVVKFKIFWNYFRDSLEINSPGTNTIVETIIPYLDEETYSFVIKSYDFTGNESVPVEVFASSYGDFFQSRISNRNLSNFIQNGNSLEIYFGDADVSLGAVATEVRYTNISDEATVVRIEASETMVNLLDYKSEAEFSTIFLPEENCLDEFYSEWTTVE